MKALWKAFAERLKALERFDVLRAASAMAFDAFISMVPLVALLGWVAHEIAESGTNVLEPLFRIAPSAVRSVADQEFMRLSEKADAVLPPLSVVGFLWLSSGGVATAMRVFERVFDAPRRTFWRRRALAMAWAIVAVVVLSLATSAAVLGVALGGLAAGIVGVTAPSLALLALLTAFFRYATRVSDPAQRSKAIRNGFKSALITLALWAIVSLGFTFYVARLSRYAQFYGGLATVVVLLLWLWLMCFALLAGGAANAWLRARGGRPEN